MSEPVCHEPPVGLKTRLSIDGSGIIDVAGRQCVSLMHVDEGGRRWASELVRRFNAHDELIDDNARLGEKVSWLESQRSQANAMD